MAKKTKHAISAKEQEALDRVIRAAAGKDAIDRCIKSSLNPKWARYQFWGTAKGNVVNCNVDAGMAKLMPESSTTVKKWRRQQARELKAAEAKLAKAAAKKAEAK